MRILFSLFFTCFVATLAVAQEISPYCTYVNATGGLNLREGPTGNHKILDKVPYGTQLRVLAIVDADQEVYVMDGDEKVFGHWVQVQPTFYWVDVNYEQVRSYVFDAYLSKHLETIPPLALHNYVQVSMNRDYEDYLEQTGVSEREDMWRDGYGCNVRYEENPAAQESLKDIIQLEVVDVEDYRDQRLVGSYEVDATWQPTKFYLENEYRPVEWEQYYLPINKGQDSILIQDKLGEYAHKVEYIGQIEALGSYLITGFPEDQEILAVNRTTGEISNFIAGYPMISPEGKYKVGMHQAYYDETTHFMVAPLRPTVAPFGLFIRFTSWMPHYDGIPFWVSEDELLIPVKPMDSNSNTGTFTNDPIWLKVTLKF